MAQIEMNMLSVITCGSISVRVFCPGMDKLVLDDREHKTHYPVLWLLHDEGGAAIDWLATPADRLAEQYGVFLIAPDQHHALCTDMKYGPRYEYFLNTELTAICRNCLPISDDPAKNWIAGVGTGAYGAVKMALKHPETFSRAAALNGVLDMEAVIQKALLGEDTGIRHNQASLEAVFGDLNAFPGSANDLFALANNKTENHFLFTWEEGSPHEAENLRLAEELGSSAEKVKLPAGSDLGSCQATLRTALTWLTR
ncbi:MAG: alpha/beta hydrolase-fold protein [Eubacteriales bacterium]|nr:alpha/beta hydrolase-fold protein [Eubacteriales bacterium]